MSEEEPTVKIGLGQIYNLVVDMSAKLTGVLAQSLVQRDKNDEFDRRIQNHGDRIRDLEAANNKRAEHGESIKELRQSVDQLEAAVNRSSWLPVLATGVLVSVIAGILLVVIKGGSL